MWRFKPILKPTIWGGNRIAAFKGRAPFPSELGPIGETYELSGMPGEESVVSEGKHAGYTLTQLIEAEGKSLVGHRIWDKYGSCFPLLVKFLDAGRDLSVQVHPDDKMAERLSLPNGKSEMWYVLEASSEARLCAGFKSPQSPANYSAMVSDGSITEQLNYTPVKPGEAYYIPAGTVHSLGKGCLVLEIQQPSDVTFRIYDFLRRDSNGNLRELHTALAQEALDFGRSCSSQILYPDERETSSGLLSTSHFTVNRMHLSYRHHRDYKDVDSFKVLVVVKGAADIDDGTDCVTATQGSVLLIAADSKVVTITPHNEVIIIETYI